MRKIEHIGIAVKNLEESNLLFQKLFGTSPYKQEEVHSTSELLEYFDRSLADGRKHLEMTTEDVLDEPWTLRNGNEVYHEATKGEIIRMTYCQIVHHRAQLGVYLRLLDIPIPGSYGPSADEEFVPIEVETETV